MYFAFYASGYVWAPTTWAAGQVLTPSLFGIGGLRSSIIILFICFCTYWFTTCSLFIYYLLLSTYCCLFTLEIWCEKYRLKNACKHCIILQRHVLSFNSFAQVCLRLPPTGECFGMPKCMFIDLRIHTNVLNDYAHRMPAKHYAYMYIRTYAHTHIRTYIT